MDSEIDFDKLGGLIPAVVQNASDSEVLMVGFMNQEAFEETLSEWLRHFLQPHSKSEAMDQGGDLRQPPACGLGQHRL